MGVTGSGAPVGDPGDGSPAIVNTHPSTLPVEVQNRAQSQQNADGIVTINPRPCPWLDSTNCTYHYDPATIRGVANDVHGHLKELQTASAAVRDTFGVALAPPSAPWPAASGLRSAADEVSTKIGQFVEFLTQSLNHGVDALHATANGAVNAEHANVSAVHSTTGGK